MNNPPTVTDHRIRRSTLTITPRSDLQKIGNTTSHVSGKGKAVAFIDGPPSPPPPPLGLLDEKEVNAAAEGGDLDDWRRFKDAGLLDEATMKRKDREALLEKTATLEKEYNMGLLLIENKDLSANVEELKEALSEIQEINKREEVARFMAVSETEKRVENLEKALDMEKHCRVDLEKALCEIGEENKQIKLSSQTKLADANNLVFGIRDKSREVDKKMQEADARLAAANERSLEIDKELQKVETRETMLQSERLLFVEEQKGWEVKSLKQKEDLQEWERKLHQGEERLCESRRIINQREEKVNEIETTLKQKEKEFKEAYNDIDLRISESKKKVDDVNDRLAKLIAKEMEAESKRRKLEMKEKELVSLTEKLNVKERVEIQKLLDAHKDSLYSKQQEFDLEMEKKRNTIEEDMRSKVEALERKEAEIKHREEKLRKLEQASEKKTERFKEKEKSLDTKLKAVREKEKSIKAEAKQKELDQKQILVDKEILQVIKDDFTKVKAEITEKELKLHADLEKHRITEDERTKHARLQSKLKEEINKCGLHRESLDKEVDCLRKDRMKFEEEWETLNEKKTAINKELRELGEQKETIEKFRKSEEERLEKDKLATKDYIKRELEVVKVEKETFAATVKQEQSLLTEKAENERRKLVHELELKQRALEVNLQNRRAEVEKQLQVREKAFEEERKKELNNISFLKEVIRKEMEEMEQEKRRIDKEKEEVSVTKKQLEGNRCEMHKDISELCLLSKKIKNQREELGKERNIFLALVDGLKNCGNCGELTRTYELSDLQMLEGRDDSPLSRTVDEIIEKSESFIAVSHETNELTSLGNIKSPNSGGLVSWFKKGVMIFKSSPHRKMDGLPLHGRMHDLKGEIEGSNVPTGINVKGQNANDSNDVQLHTPENINREVEAPEDSQQSELRSGRRKPVRKAKVAGARKRHTVKASVEDSLKTSEAESLDDEKGGGTSMRKRSHAQASLVSGSDMEASESEACSESVTTGGRRKRRQTAVQTPGEKRYNLRGHKTVEVIPPTQASVDIMNGNEVNGSRTSGASKVIQNLEIASGPSTEVATEDGNAKPLMLVTPKRVDTLESDKLPGDAILEENIEMSDDVNGTNEYSGDGGGDGDDDGGGDDNDDGDNASEQHPGEISIGKKLWTFFST
ncbi:hypothetical protein Ccrd_001598 [Cynara cardunculus var. scolymus]|uniref:Uncharacterized protein n=1 Tax=Cynara cardunculus var. scolymus TaxID=59895 RepID=A0A103XSY7_CYNCS|nr:hypothetical protein Ccrd_001598 [Cynara cardunculus var. scolymus]